MTEDENHIARDYHNAMDLTSVTVAGGDSTDTRNFQAVCVCLATLSGQVLSLVDS